LSLLVVHDVEAGRSCASAGRRVLAANTVTVITARAEHNGNYTGVRACVRQTGRLSDLQDVGERNPLVAVRRPWALSGMRFAYVGLQTDAGGDGHALFVTNVSRPGRRVALDSGPSHDPPFRSVVVRRGGSTAWITGAGTRGYPYVVLLCERKPCLMRDHDFRVLDRGTDIRPQSLRRRGDRVLWTAGGRTRSAPMR